MVGVHISSLPKHIFQLFFMEMMEIPHFIEQGGSGFIP
jgi:hypothetical protein